MEVTDHNAGTESLLRIFIGHSSFELLRPASTLLQLSCRTQRSGPEICSELVSLTCLPLEEGVDCRQTCSRASLLMGLHFPQSAGKSEGFGTTWLYKLYS